MKTIVHTGWVALAMMAMHPADAVAQSAVFSADQVQRGQSAYFGACASCHGYDLVKVDGEATDLTGAEFGENWVGRSIRERLEYISTNMPANDPGSLQDQAVLDIIAFVLEANGFPPGDTEVTMAADLEAMLIPDVP